MALHFWDLLIENKWNKLQPGLAVSWKPLDDKTWEFKLREGVKWQDGTPFTADDLIYSTRAPAPCPAAWPPTPATCAPSTR